MAIRIFFYFRHFLDVISAIAFDRPTHFTQPSGMGRQLRVRCVRVSKEGGGEGGGESVHRV